MAGLQEKRAEETKRAITAAAGELFRDKGYAQVSMREIAKQAGCSHTTIYLYFKDKEALLHQLSAPPLEQLRLSMNEVLEREGGGGSSDERLKELVRMVIAFCLSNRSVFGVLFGTNAVRVDEENPTGELNRLRLELFALLKRELGRTLGLDDGDRLLAFSRMLYYYILGIAETYANSEESTEQLMDRLGATFDESADVLLLGFRARIQQSRGEESK